MGENALALLQYLSGPDSPLPSLTTGYKPPTTVFFSFLGLFIVYSFTTAKLLYLGLLITALLLVHISLSPRAGGDGINAVQYGVQRLVAGFIGAIIASNIVAGLMHRVLDSGMSWFKAEYLAPVLYTPPSILGEFTCCIFLFLRLFARTRWSSASAALQETTPGDDNLRFIFAPSVLPRICCSDVQHRLRSTVLHMCPTALYRILPQPSLRGYRLWIRATCRSDPEGREGRTGLAQTLQ
jgi:hypothetical protein